MLDIVRTTLIGQFEAALCTLNECIVRCPEELWNGPMINHPYSESIFHALFYADLYLGNDIESVKLQEFHKEHAAVFEGYEELASSQPTKTYEKDFILKYVKQCRTKANEVISKESESELSAVSGFNWLAEENITRTEAHVYNIRHVQHHAAQAIARIRQANNELMPWVRTGWPQYS